MLTGKVTAGVMAVACERRGDGSGLAIVLKLMEQVRERERKEVMFWRQRGSWGRGMFETR